MSATLVSLAVPDFKAYYNQNCIRQHQIEEVISTICKAVEGLADGLMTSFPVDKRLFFQLLAQRFDKDNVSITLEFSEKFKDYNVQKIVTAQADECVLIDLDQNFYYVIHKGTPNQLDAGQLPDQGATELDLPVGAIVEGRTTDRWGNILMGRFAQLRQNQFEIKYGKMVLESGGSLEGEFGYVPSTNETFLKHGVKTYEKESKAGHWEYDEATQSIEQCENCRGFIEEQSNVFVAKEKIDLKLKQEQQYILKELLQTWKFASPNFDKSSAMIELSKKIGSSIDKVNSDFCKLIDAKPRDNSILNVQILCKELKKELKNAVQQLQIFTHSDKNVFFNRTEEQIEIAKSFHNRLVTLKATLEDRSTFIQKLFQEKMNLFARVRT